MTPPRPLDRYSLQQRPAPRARRATCEEVDCWAWLGGFAIKVDEATDLGGRQAAYLREDRTRPRPAETREGALTVFAYPPGTRCTASDTHVIERTQLYIARGIATTAELWTEEFGENQQRLSELQARG